jgi:DNA polymerase
MAEELNEVIAELRERVLYLKELGVEALSVEVARMGERQQEPKPSPEVDAPPPVAISNLRSEISDPKREEPSRPAGSRLAQLPSLKERKPSKFFDKYNPREKDAGPETGDRSAEPTASKSQVELVSARADTTETIAEIRAEIGSDCTRCKLSQLGRSKVVNSVGNPNAELMFCGEAPGADEDRLGEPFVGRAGQLLTDIIEKGLEIPRSDVFIGNINRCRPPGNRAPEEDESSVCKPFILREIAVVRPKVIVTLGATATQNLLETKMPIGKLRGKFHEFHGSKVMPTFHPAYLLRDPNKKREVWDDMKLVKEYLRGK